MVVPQADGGFAQALSADFDRSWPIAIAAREGTVPVQGHVLPDVQLRRCGHLRSRHGACVGTPGRLLEDGCDHDSLTELRSGRGCRSSSLRSTDYLPGLSRCLGQDIRNFPGRRTILAHLWKILVKRGKRVIFA